MAALPVARNVNIRPDSPPALPAPETVTWPSDAPENLEGAPEPEPYNEKPDEHEVIDKATRVNLMITLTALNMTDDERHDLVRHVTGGVNESSKQLTYADMPAIWERVTTRATIEVQKLFGLLFRESATGWDKLRQLNGLKGEVKTWQLNEWLIALNHCREWRDEMDEDNE
jgi:hypothetical protein